MHCHYCGKRLPISKVLRGHTFCSLEHQELHLSSGATEAFDRLRESFDPSPPKRPKAEQAREGAVLFQPDQPQLEPLGTPPPVRAEETVQDAPSTPEVIALSDAIAETPVAESQPVEAEQQGQERSSAHELAALMEGVGSSIEPQTVEAGLEDDIPSPALVVASPIESSETTEASDLPQAWSLFGLSSILNQPAFSLKGPGAEPTSGGIQLPTTGAPELPVRNSSPVIVDISGTRTRGPVDAAPISSHPTWRNVAPGYPPVIVTDSATLVVDPKAAGFIPVAMGTYPGEGPSPLRENEAIDPPLRKPQLPSAQPERQLPFDLSELWASLEPAGLSEIPWQPRQWFTTVSLAPMSALAPQCDVVLKLAAASRDKATPVAAAGCIAMEFAVPAPSKVVTATAAPHLAATIDPSLPRSHREALARPGSLAPGPVFGQQPTAIVTAWPGEPPARIEAFSSVPVDVNQSLPRTDTAVLAAEGLSPEPRACAVERPIAKVSPPSVEIGSAETSSVPALRHPAPVSMAAPSLPASSSISLLPQEAHRLPAGVNAQQPGPAIAHLRPALPSPWSLVTCAPSLAISGAAPKPSNVCHPAPLEITANQGHVEGIAWSPGQRGYRLLPSLPGPGGIAIPQAPAQAPAQFLALTALRPASEGTASPDLIRIRVHATPMSVLALNFQRPRTEEEIGLPWSGLFLEDSLKLACINSALAPLQIAGEVPTEPGTVLPAFCSNEYAPALGWATSSDRAWGEAVPPNQPIRSIVPFSALTRVAGSVAAF